MEQFRDYSFDEIEKNIDESLEEFKKHDTSLLEADVSEWAIAHQLGCYLKKLSPEYHVDMEYNRREKETKKGNNGDLVRLDIVIHERLEPVSHNLTQTSDIQE